MMNCVSTQMLKDYSLSPETTTAPSAELTTEV